MKVGAVAKSGSWYSYEGEKIGQGRENAKIFLKEHPDIMKDVENKVRTYYGLPTDVLADATEEDGPAKSAPGPKAAGGEAAKAGGSGNPAGRPADKAE